MPRIPQAENQPSINVGAPPKITTPEMGLTAVSKSMQAQGEVVQAIANAEDAIIKVRDFRQQTEAQNYAFERLSEIKSRADQDINFDSTPYDTEIDKVGQEAAKTISGRLAKEDFMANFQRSATATKWGIKNDFRAKELKSIDASIDYQGQQIIDNYGGMNDADRIVSVANFRKSLENGVRVGLYNKATADAKYVEFQKKVISGTVDYGILNDPQTALAELQKGNEGAYPGLTQTERVNFIKEAETRIEKLNNQQKEAIAIATNKREGELIDMKIAGTLTVPDVKKERELGGISASFADTMIRALENPKIYKPTALEGIVKFNELVERNVVMARKEKSWFNMGKVPFEDIAKFRADTINANAKGYISDKQMTDLLSETSKTFYRDPIFQNALNQLAAQSKLYATSEAQARIKAEMYGDLITKVIAGKNPGEAVTEVINENTENILAKFNKEFSNKIRVKRKSDGQQGSILKEDFNPEIYEKI